MTSNLNRTKQIISLTDLTSLNQNDTTSSILSLTSLATTNLGQTAAVCIYPPFIQTAKEALKETSIKIATVVNFPSGNEPIETIRQAIQTSILQGADEIDIVLPYQSFMAGDVAYCREVLEMCREACGSKVMKVIIESGVLQDAELIENASRLCVDCGCDFVKTSTGKVKVNATIEAVEVIVGVIKENGGKCGVKIAGGVRSFEQADAYLRVIEDALGVDWVCRDTVRFGASSLINNLVDSDY